MCSCQNYFTQVFKKPSYWIRWQQPVYCLLDWNYFRTQSFCGGENKLPLYEKSLNMYFWIPKEAFFVGDAEIIGCKLVRVIGQSFYYNDFNGGSKKSPQIKNKIRKYNDAGAYKCLQARQLFHGKCWSC